VPEVQTPPVATSDEEVPTVTAEPEPELIQEDLLVEDVSIDGMCGVY
jgi:mycofactocin precursor